MAEEEPPIDIGYMSLPAQVQQAVEAEMAVSSCEHVYASHHVPGHLVYWVRKCMVCHEVDWDDLDREIGELVGAERERIARLATEHKAEYPLHERPGLIVAHPPFADLIREENSGHA